MSMQDPPALWPAPISQTGRPATVSRRIAALALGVPALAYIAWLAPSVVSSSPGEYLSEWFFFLTLYLLPAAVIGLVAIGVWRDNRLAKGLAWLIGLGGIPLLVSPLLAGGGPGEPVLEALFVGFALSLVVMLGALSWGWWVRHRARPGNIDPA